MGKLNFKSILAIAVGLVVTILIVVQLPLAPYVNLVPRSVGIVILGILVYFCGLAFEYRLKRLVSTTSEPRQCLVYFNSEDVPILGKKLYADIVVNHELWRMRVGYNQEDWEFEGDTGIGTVYCNRFETEPVILVYKGVTMCAPMRVWQIASDTCPDGYERRMILGRPPSAPQEVETVF